MFGLEEQKNKKTAEFEFDLEKEFKQPMARRRYKEQFEGRIQQIKKTLREGKEQDKFDQYGVLLHGYTSVIKVISRFSGGK